MQTFDFRNSQYLLTDVMLVGVMLLKNETRTNFSNIHYGQARAFSMSVVALRFKAQPRSVTSFIQLRVTSSEQVFIQIVQNIGILGGFRTLLASTATLKLRDQILS